MSENRCVAHKSNFCTEMQFGNMFEQNGAPPHYFRPGSMEVGTINRRERYLKKAEMLRKCALPSIKWYYIQSGTCAFPVVFFTHFAILPNYK
jgi:hypothetical protein